MATAPLQPLRLPRQAHHRRSFPSTSLPSSSFSPFPRRSLSLSLISPLPSPSAAAATSTAAAAVTSTSGPPSLQLLAQHLAAGDFLRADDVTRRLLILLAGDAAQKRGYVFFSEVKFISAADLQEIDRLWLEHSDGRYGYSVQRRIWEKARRDFTKFFVKVGWMKKLDTEVEQYNYRGFPEDFTWGKDEGAPDGHLPLTNALRGTQLLYCILTHPAFEGAAEEISAAVEPAAPPPVEGSKAAGVRRLFRTDYSF